MNLKVEANAGKYEVKSLALSLTIIEFIAQAGDDGIGVSEVARAVSTPKSNAYRILQTLRDRGYVADSGEGPMRRYRLGVSFLRLANAATSQRPLADQVRPHLRQLTLDTSLTSRFAVLDRGYVVALVREPAPEGVQIAPYLGQRELSHCSGVGKALLAFLPPTVLADVIHGTGLPRRTNLTIVDIDRMNSELQTVRNKGYAIDDEEDFEGVFGIGSPVFDHSGQVVGGINVSGLKLDRTTKDLIHIAQMVRRSARAFSAQLGYSPQAGHSS